MFTRIAKGILVLLMIAVTAIALWIAFTTDAGLFGFLAALFIGSSLLISLGVLVELANNIMDIKVILVEASKKDFQKNHKEEMSLDDAESEPTLIVDGKWVCRKCKTKNELSTAWCTFCGKQTRSN